MRTAARLRGIFGALRGGQRERHRLGELANQVLNPGHFYGESDRSWYREARSSLPLSAFPADGLARRWDRLWTLGQLTGLVGELEGDIAEMGVHAGASAAVMLEAKPSAHYWGFDSFEGLSAPVPDVDGGYWSAGDLGVALETAADNLAEWQSRVTLVKGWIPDCFGAVDGPPRLSISHIDVDLYQPTAEALEYCAGRTILGGMIVCDDYGFDTCPGARQAIDEFLVSTPSWRLAHLPTGQGLLVRG